VVGRGLVHEEGVALIEEWIAEMSFPELTRAQAEMDAVREEQAKAVEHFKETAQGD